MNNNDEIFNDLPPIPDGIIKTVQNCFQNYLWLEVKGRGKKHYVCSACGAEYDSGAAVPQRTVTERDVALWRAQHNDICECVSCGKKLQVINIKKRKVGKLNEEKFFAIFLPVNHDRVWVRCVGYNRLFEYNSGGYNLPGEWSLHEYHRYLLEPGKAEMYDGDCYNGWYKQKICRDAFVWNHSVFCEKYPYAGLYCNTDGVEVFGTQEEVLDGTFLKYASFYKYDGHHVYNAPYMKYMCWYARHPQIEMLVKMQKFEIVDRMIFYNTDEKKIFDWSARTPWGLHRMDKQLYDAYEEYSKHNTGGGKISLFKTFGAIHGKKAKDLEAAEKINCMFRRNGWAYDISRGSINEFLTLCKKENVDPRDMYKYLEKYQKTTAGACWHCPGITLHEVGEMWLDYINMAIAKQNLDFKKNKSTKRKKPVYNINPMPKDLKEAHDELIRVKKRIENEKNKAEAAKRAAARLKEIKKEAKTLEEKYPKAAENMKRVKAVFEYSSDDFKIVVPESIFDILVEGETLSLCISRENARDRYLDRIERNESYLLFLRRSEEPDSPWYTLEVEPDGTIRQKRTVNDDQNEDLLEASDFLSEWQKAVSSRMTETDRKYSRKSRELFRENQAELRRTGKRVHYGTLAGQLLADVFDNDLMVNENESEATA